MSGTFGDVLEFFQSSRVVVAWRWGQNKKAVEPVDEKCKVVLWSQVASKSIVIKASVHKSTTKTNK